MTTHRTARRGTTARWRARLSVRDWPLLLAGVLILVGAALASWVQTDGGRIKLQDVRFTGFDGKTLAGLLYVPAGVDDAHPAPAVLAVHGYINTRETQDGFAIELARRGFVVLALDQRGHGHSTPPAFAAGFGGPDALAWLQRQPLVDAKRIALIGHSMGGWAVLSAARAYPDGYRAMVLVGSAPDVAGAPAGDAQFPRNLAVVFSRWDEFSDLMWNAPNGLAVARSAKLRALFDSGDTGVVPDRMYGEFANGSARMYHVPETTHPGDHLSSEVIGETADWLQSALDMPAESARAPIWFWKEIGTGMAMLGGILLLAALPRALLRLPLFAPLCSEPALASAGLGTILVTAILPALLYFPLFNAADKLVPLRQSFPQQLNNGLLLWVLVLGLVTLCGLVYRWLLGERSLGLTWKDASAARALGAIVLGVFTVFVWFVALTACERFLQVDFRFWVVAMKTPAPWHWPMLLSYAPALCAFFLLSHASTSGLIDGRAWLIDAWMVQVAAYCGGFVLLLLLQYGALLLDQPLLFGQPLLTVLAIQFLVLLAFVAFVHVCCYRRTGTVWLGATINGLWVSIVVVSGQATQFAVTG